MLKGTLNFGQFYTYFTPLVSKGVRPFLKNHPLKYYERVALDFDINILNKIIGEEGKLSLLELVKLFDKPYHSGKF